MSDGGGAAPGRLLDGGLQWGAFQLAELQEGAVSAVLRVPTFALAAHAVASGVLDRMDGVGPRAIPLRIGQPVKAAIADGEVVLCWITNEPILPGQLDMDHVIPWSYGGATNEANLQPALASANRSRGNSLEVLADRKIGWKWDVDDLGNRVRVPDPSQRLVRVSMLDDKVLNWSVPKFDVGELATGASSAAAFALAIEGAVQWRAGEFHADELAEEAAKAAAGYAARYSTKIAVKALVPRTMPFLGQAGAEMLGGFAGPVGFVVAIYGAEAIEQGFALARGKVTPARAAKEFALAPIGAVRDTADLVFLGYKLLSPKHRAVRRNREKWRSINFVPDLQRADPFEVLALAI